MKTYFEVSSIEAQKTYTYELETWCREYCMEKSDKIEGYYFMFLDRINKVFSMNISFDDRIMLAFKKLSKKYDFIEFSTQVEHQSYCKKQLLKVADILHANRFISKKDLKYIQDNLFGKTMMSSLQAFLEALGVLRAQNPDIYVTAQIIQKLWKKQIGLNFKQTWNSLIKKKIYHQIIDRILAACKPLIQSYSSEFIKQIDSYQQANQNALTSIKQVTLLALPQRKAAYNQQLNKIVVDKSLALNTILYNKAINQIHQFHQSIRQLGFQQSTFEIYGSIRTKLALLNNADADINVIINGFQQDLHPKMRQMHFSQLLLAFQKNRFNKYDRNTKFSLINFQGLKVPFIKVLFLKNQQEEDNRIIRRIDITLNSIHGPNNSKLIQMYTSNQSILKLCNLVKLWAKQKNIINLKNPFQGLSSYGTVLMTIFYLIKTEQAPSIVKRQNNYIIDVGFNYQLDDQFKGKTLVTLMQNFKGWLNYYSRNGLFFKQNQIVCLLKTFYYPQKLYDKKIIFNMYDFIDESNPGRMTNLHGEGHNFFRNLQEALDLLESSNGTLTILSELRKGLTS